MLSHAAESASNGRRRPALMNHIFFCITWMVDACTSLTWGTPGSRKLYGKKTSRQRQCDSLGKVLLENLGSGHPGGRCFGTYHVWLALSQNMYTLCGLCQQDVFEELTWLPGENGPIHGGPASQHTGLKECAANIFVEMMPPPSQPVIKLQFVLAAHHLVLTKTSWKQVSSKAGI